MRPTPLVVAIIDVSTDVPRPDNTYLIVRCLAGEELERIEQLDDGTFELHTAGGPCNVDALVVPPTDARHYTAMARRDPSRVMADDTADLGERLAAIRPRAATPNIDFERGAGAH